MRIELVLMQLPEPALISLEVASGTTVDQAVHSVGWAQREGTDWNQLGLWGKVCDRHQLLKEGDRIELYQALKCDPKTARKRREIKKKRKT